MNKMIDENRLDICLKHAEAILAKLEAQESEKLDIRKTTQKHFDEWLLQKQIMIGIVGTLRVVKTGDLNVFTTDLNTKLVKTISEQSTNKVTYS
jgi:hypothetical protein